MSKAQTQPQAPTAEQQLDASLYDWECRRFLRRQLGDVRFYTRHAQGRVLELACGTGRVTEALLGAGLDVVALDLHPGMLALARTRLAPGATLIQGDMRHLELSTSADTVVIAYNSFQLLCTRADQESCLRGVHHHLRKDGRLLMEVTPFLLRDPPSDWAHRATASLHDDPTDSVDNPVVCSWERCRTTPAAQLNHFDVRYELFDPDGTRSLREHTLSLRTVFRFELELLLERCGFVLERVDGDYDGTPLEGCDDEGMVVLARRA